MMTKPWEETWAFDGRWVSVMGGKYPNHIACADYSDDGRLTERGEMLAAAPDLARVLLAVEWNGGYTLESGATERDGKRCDVCDEAMSAMCASCDGTRATGHAPDCALDAALRKAGIR